MLDRSFYRQDGITVARGLLGCTLHHKTDHGHYCAKIVETEAYMGAVDRGSHAYGNRRTDRTETLYADGGTVYVYLIYGMYHLFNVVASVKDVPEAVLIRAVEPLGDLSLFQKNRQGKKRSELTSGPGKLARAMAIDLGHNGMDLVRSDRLWIEEGDTTPQIVAAPRVGIDYAGEDKDKLWRFFIEGHPDVSKGR